MDSLIKNIQFNINPSVYTKYPESSKLGKSILLGSVELMCELGYEQFTFKKLAEHIGSTEASVYRYFENKHKLLIYLNLWYWNWQEYRLVFGLNNIPDPRQRLKRAIELLTENIEDDSDFSHMSESKLHQIIISESSKVYLSKMVDKDNSEGFFKPFKDVVARVSEIIVEISPNYKYPHMLATSIIEGAHHHMFYAEHLPGLTDCVKGEDSVKDFYLSMVNQLFNE